MKQMEVEYLGELRTQGTHLKSAIQIITDAPLDNNGKGEAYSPTDLVASALASCMITIMGIQANKNGWNITGVKAEVEKIMSTNPRKISGVRITLSFPASTPNDHEARTVLEKAALSCPVALSLHPDIRQEVEFNY
ncbi:MAG: osmotically inducible protein OsmC [Chitinophagaceae bacterium]|nr:osmotically inducible protein OsmC [Chitinophagaceae bacterium]